MVDGGSTGRNSMIPRKVRSLKTYTDSTINISAQQTTTPYQA
jgi:hypothetical protein